MLENKVLVYLADQCYKANLLADLLAANDIQSFVINKKDTNYLFGDVEVYVEEDDVIRAKVLIEKFDKR